MNDPSEAVCAGIIRALELSAAVHNEVSDRVYDEAPEEATYPYIVLGDVNVTPDIADSGEVDQLYDGAIIETAVHVYTSQTGRALARRVGAVIAKVLDDEIDITGYAVIVHDVAAISYGRDEERRMFGIVSVRYEVCPTA
ncbi:DUF3168 domain-containing protein [Asticcacaulis sp. ZE23SCel15]|uniref:DUF3168 domain-containing protein n=1 Tax=Asticcacaulis sp. ZE23SCel15 TaxID=3059027 RepID=UPI00265F4D11|nr:DUF3168 domain-containing protein [Asticcacaulis sp. ZE23SCel15]WKL57239.1 DUF3168 domain-containing protein [Asticcacaulis sp. ZE23SCel15]